MTTSGSTRAGRGLGAVAGAFVGLLIVAAAGAGTWRYLNDPTGASEAVVRVEEGMSARAIGQRLEDLGLIRSARLFEADARLRGVTGQLEAGNYRLSGRVTTDELLSQLLRAPVELSRVTVPEGLTRQQTAALLQRHGLADSASFVASTEGPRLIAELDVAAPTLEGYLFPETYFLVPGISEEEIVRRMVGEFFEGLSDSLYDQLQILGLSLHQAVTLASMVEREAAVAQERPLISSIFLRRLRLDRRLESCATVEYALGVHKERLTHDDLKVQSPYNTYLHPGLPPGPIGNPGRASLLATFYPDSADYLYFVARGDGTHEFSRTLAEHEAARRAIRHQLRAPSPQVTDLD